MKTNYKKSLGKEEASVLDSLIKHSLYFFRVNDVKKLTDKKPNAIYQLLFKLKKKGWLYEIEKGKYVILGFGDIAGVDEYFIASHIITPSYISFWSAIRYYNLTEQLLRGITVAITRSKKEMKFKSFKVRFININKKRFFGYKKEFLQGKEIFVGEMEKVLIDSLYLPGYAGGISEIAKALDNSKKALNMQKLIEYVIKMNSRVITRRLGYLLDALKIKIAEDLMTKLSENIGKGYSKLEPAMPKKGKLNKKWHLIINITDKQMLYWRRFY